jgi:hypothetical protein
MPETTAVSHGQTDQTSLSDAGHTTSENKLTKAVAIAGAIIVGLTATFVALQPLLPNAAWIAIAVTILTTIGGVVATVSKYIGGRTEVKTAMARIDVANTLAAAGLLKPSQATVEGAVVAKPSVIIPEAPPASP